MPSDTGNWHHATAIVLVLSPPGLLLIATWLRLRNIPFTETIEFLERWLVFLAGINDPKLKPVTSGRDKNGTKNLLTEIGSRIEREQRLGHDSRARVEQLLHEIRTIQEKTREISGLAIQLAYKSFAALAFCSILPGFLTQLGRTNSATEKVIGYPLLMVTASMLATVGLVPFIQSTRKALLLIDFRETRVKTGWLNWLSDGYPPHSPVETGSKIESRECNRTEMKRLATSVRIGVDPEPAKIRAMERHRSALKQDIGDIVHQIEKNLTIFEMASLLPASTLVILSGI